uniref:Peroxidase n=1 Tax=Allium sativum TaxID=4682 RepID=H2CLW6_ALLSA|nr:peroxidase ATP17a-like protein [Allium sativum]
MAKIIISYIVNLSLVLFFVNFNLKVEALSMGYYILRCPFAEMIVRSTVNQALSDDPTLAAGLLRMHFHDCFVEGCDGSVLIDSTKENTAEKDSPANLSLRGYEIIDAAKAAVENQCPGVVSCADIITMAARDAVFFAGGPFYDMPKGRMDGRRSKIEDTIRLPAPVFNSTTLINVFSQHGFSAQEVVAFSGAHTLGVARCTSFKNRLSNFDTTHNVDPSLNSKLANTLSQACSAGDNSEAPLDPTKNSFDNAYFNKLQTGEGVLTSDQTLYTNPRTRSVVNAYAMNQALFFLDFQQAIIKMGLIDVKEGNQGEVRQDCRKIN